MSRDVEGGREPNPSTKLYYIVQRTLQKFIRLLSQLIQSISSELKYAEQMFVVHKKKATKIIKI